MFRQSSRPFIEMALRIRIFPLIFFVVTMAFLGSFFSGISNFFFPSSTQEPKAEMAAVAPLVEELIKKNLVMVFSKSYCPYCNRAKGLLSKLQLEYKALELDVDENGSEIQNYLKSKTGQRTVPNIFIRGQHIGGSDDLHKLHDKGGLVPLVKGT